MSTRVIILAAGQGKRMHSRLPKVLQPLGGACLIEHVIQAAATLPGSDVHIVHGHGGDAVQDALRHLDVSWVEQTRQLGTGHAVAQALPHADDSDTVLVLYGDVPLVRTQTLSRLIEACQRGALAVLTTELNDPSGYGRVIRDGDDRITRIVEERDANSREQTIREINTGLLCAPADLLRAWIDRLDSDNAQGEYYLTDVISMATADGVPVAGVAAPMDEVQGVNDRVQLSIAEATLRARRAGALLASGVTLRDPRRFDQRGELRCGRDVVIDVNCVFEGHVELGDGVHVGPNCVLRNAVVGSDTRILSHSIVDGATLGSRCRVGPFSRLRPASQFSDDVRVGNFVEIKKSQVGEGSKINHLAYLGDATVGRDVNIGAGAITCNYDSVNKHQTTIGNDVFVGSDTQFVAPVTIGNGATIGAGSTITRDVADNELALSRHRQKTTKDWQRPDQRPHLHKKTE